MIEGQEDVTWPQWVALAQACEAAGIEGLFSSDHYLSVLGREERGSFDAWSTLTALATVTKRLRLGTLVSPVTFRHPAVLAKLAITADHVSNGRIEVGIGAGWYEREHLAFGFPLPKVDMRMQLLAEQLEIIHRLWLGEPVTFNGSQYQLEDVTAKPRAVQRPHPPVIVGGWGGPRSIGLAARWADEYNSVPASVNDCRVRAQRARDACAKINRDPATLRMSMMTTCIIGDNYLEVNERVRRAAAIVDEPEADYLATLHREGVVGTIDQALDRLAELEAAGLDRIMLRLWAHDDLDMIELLGRLMMGSAQ